jgi:hypothetical protein
MCFKKTAMNTAFESGARRCPCCDVQLVWKANPGNQQRNLATVDHIVPRSMGGADSAENMFVMCRMCNHTRATECFVKFVTERGVSKSLAEDLYHKAHTVSLQMMILNQFTQVVNGRENALKVNKTRRKQIKAMIKNYTAYFGDYLPEFNLLQKLA